MTAVKQFLIDSFVAGLGIKAPCKAVSITPITLSGEQTVNGVAVTEDDRVLVTAQAFAVDNGIYNVSTSAWTRALDFDGNRDVVTGTQVAVVQSGVQDNLYEVTTADPITIGSSAITFALRYGANATYDKTTEEIAAGVTPTDLSFPAGDMRRYGADSTGASDSSSAFENGLSVGLKYYTAPGEYLISTPVNVVTSNFTLDIDKFTTASAIDCFVIGVNNQGADLNDSGNIRCENVQFIVRDADGGNTVGSKAFNCANMRELVIRANMSNFEYGVYISPRTSSSHHIPDRVQLYLSTYFIDYPVYQTATITQTFVGSNDINIYDSLLQKALCNVYLERVGGVYIADSIMYQDPNVASGRTQNIYLGRCNRAHISNVECFEAGTHGIEIEGGTLNCLSNVQVTWVGQLAESSGVYIHDEATTPETATHLNLSNVMVDKSSKHGFHFDGVDYITFSAQSYANSNEQFLGGPSLADTYSGMHIENCRYFNGRLLSTSGGQHKYDLDVATSNQLGVVRLVSAGSATADVNPDTVNVVVDAPLLSKSELITASRTLLAVESGKTFYLNSAGGFTLTLPAPTRGIEYQFAVTINPTSDYNIVTDSGDNIMHGTFLDIVGEQVAFANRDTFTFIGGTSIKGDSVTFHSDGTNWHVRGFSAVNTGISTSVT